MFYFSYINGLVPRSRNALDLQNSQTFINSNSCLHIPTFRSQTAIVSEKSTVFSSSHRKAYVTKFDLVGKYVKVTPGSPFVQTMMGRRPECYIPSYMEIRLSVPENKICERVFTIYNRGGHLGHVTLTIYTNFGSPFPRRLHIEFGFDWPSGFREEDI